MIKSWLAAALFMAVMIFILGGCSQGGSVSASEMMNEAIVSAERVQDFYGELETNFYPRQGEVERTTSKEWLANDGRRKVATHYHKEDYTIISLADYQKQTFYDPAGKRAYVSDIEDQQEVSPYNPKDYMISLFEKVKDTHKLENKGDETLLGLKAMHIVLHKEEESSAHGEINLWIEQKTWLPLKYIEEVEEGRVEMIYTKVDFSPKFPPGTFTLKMPADVKVESAQQRLQRVSLTKAKRMLGKAFLVFPSTKQIKLSQVMHDGDTQEISLFYIDDQNKPLLTLTVQAAAADTERLKKGKWQVRRHQAAVFKETNRIVWDEGGLQYAVEISQPDNIKFEDIVSMAKEMKYSSKE